MNYNYGSGRSEMFGLTPMLKNLIFINVGVFLFQFIISAFRFQGESLSGLFEYFFRLNPLFTPDYKVADAGFWPWQLVSYQFMHGGFTHLFFNMFGLWMFGSELEKLWGSPKFLLFYLLAGIGAGVTQMLVNPLLGSMASTVGASGSLYGILLAYGLTYPRRPIFMFPFFIPIPAFLFVCIYAAIEMYSGVFGSADGVAHFAHLGGALTGLILIRFGDSMGIYKIFSKLFKKQRVNPFNQIDDDEDSRPFSFGSRKPNYTNERYDDKPKVYDSKPKRNDDISLVINGEKVNQQVIDTILDKISAKGYQSLTEKERFILNELSKRI